MSAEPLPPHNRDAERRLLGGILRYPDALLTLAGNLAAESFFTDAHQSIFRAMLDLAAARKPIDLVLVHEQLHRSGQLENAGGVPYLTELWECEPTGAMFEHYAAVVRDKATTRAVIHAATEILRDAFDGTPADDLLAQAERKILAIGEAATPINDAVKSAAEFLPAATQRIDERIASGGQLRGLATGYRELDEVLAGLRPSEQVVIAARPSVGKTAFTLNILANVATTGIPVLFFSLEMPLDDIADRLLAMGSGVPLHRFTKAPAIEPHESDRLIEAAGPGGLGGCPIYVDDTSDATAARIAAVTRRMVRRHGVKLVAIDYLGLMRPENTKCTKAEQVGTMALRVKNLAREVGIPVLLVAQLNREIENRGDGKPKLSDLRDSGEIEQHGDRVLLLSRAAGQPNDQELWRIDVSIAKNRNGPTGDIALSWRRPVMRFENGPARW